MRKVVENLPARSDHTSDFTVENYRGLLRLAKKNYQFIRYTEIDNNPRFLLWRHDCDFSLNRAFRLAKIEQSEEVVATYFVNPHSEFYNLFEKSQSTFINGIRDAGHDIGLHFDAAYYDVVSEQQLGELVASEANLLESFFGIKPTVFSFHNPTPFILTCERKSYGGLLNCYSTSFKREIAYCSDSNGYWRHRRLSDVLQEATDSMLQVLTHPGWWQETALEPRQRVFRCVYGRAEGGMRLYDAAVDQFGRSNIRGPAVALGIVNTIAPAQYSMLEYLWSKGFLSTLFAELWRLHEAQIFNFCRMIFQSIWNVPNKEIEAFFQRPRVEVACYQLFQTVFGKSWLHAISDETPAHGTWSALKARLIMGSEKAGEADSVQLEDGCVYLCSVMERLNEWWQAQGFTEHAQSAEDDSKSYEQEWSIFLKRMAQTSGGSD
jgi:hypothetical protein